MRPGRVARGVGRRTPARGAPLPRGAPSADGEPTRWPPPPAPARPASARIASAVAFRPTTSRWWRGRGERRDGGPRRDGPAARAPCLARGSGSRARGPDRGGAARPRGSSHRRRREASSTPRRGPSGAAGRDDRRHRGGRGARGGAAPVPVQPGGVSTTWAGGELPRHPTGCAPEAPLEADAWRSAGRLIRAREVGGPSRSGAPEVTRCQDFAVTGRPAGPRSTRPRAGRAVRAPGAGFGVSP